MLNRENAVIAYETERGNKVTPILLTVAEADRAEYPRTVDLVAVMLGIENAGALGVEFIDLRILGMNVVDGDNGKRIRDRFPAIQGAKDRS